MRSIQLELINCNAGNRKSDLKPIPMLSYQVEKYVVSRQITFFSDFIDDGFIGIIIIIIVIISYIEKPVSPEPERLMNLEIETDCSHKCFNLNKS